MMNHLPQWCRSTLCCLLLFGGLPLLAQPANDECVNAVSLTVNADLTNAISTSGTIAGATMSAQGNGTCFGTEDDDVWYSFVATDETHQISLFNISGGTTDLYHVLWSGTCAAPVQVNCSDPNVSTVSGLTVGDTYLVQVYSWTSAAGQTSNFEIAIGSLPPPPANDDCDNAVSLTVNPDFSNTATTAGTIASATMSVQGNGTCGGTEDDDVWYSFVATNETHRIELINITGGTTDLYHVLWSGTCAAPVQENCSDPNASTVSGLTVGDTYLVQVYSWTGTAGQTSSFEISIGTPPPPPANDDCVNAEVLTVSSELFCDNAVPGTITSATDSGVDQCTGTEDDDVWYSFVATDTVHYAQINNVAGAAVRFGLHTGTCDALVNVSCSTSGTSLLEGLTIGETYFLQVYTFTATAGQVSSFDICVSEVGDELADAANDECADAQSLSVETEGFQSYEVYNNIGATNSMELPAPPCGSFGNDDAGDFDVYFSITALSDTLIVELEPGTGLGSTDFAMTAYSGTCGDLTLIECDDDDGPGAMPRLELGGLTPGETYLFRVYDFGGNQEGVFGIAAFQPLQAVMLDCPAADSIFVGDDCIATLGDLTGDVTADDGDSDDSNDGDVTITQDSLDGTMIAFDPAGTNMFDVTLTATSPNNPMTGTCVITVTVLDTTAPILTCQDVAIDLSATGMSTVDNMMLQDSVVVSATDNCDGEVTVSQDDEVTISCASNGTATVSYTATDASGNESTCTSTITVNDPTEFCAGALVIECGPTTDSLAVGDDCMVALGDYTTTVMTNAATITQEPAAGELVGLGDTTVLVIATIGDMADTCTIAINVADTTAPVAVCTDVEVFLDEEGNVSISGASSAPQMAVTTISGSLDADDPEFERPTANGLNCTVSTGAPVHSYDVFEFTIDQEDMYTFSMVPNTNGDFYFLLYDGPFDPNAPCDNFIEGDDDAAGSLDPQIMIQLTLVPGAYTLVTTEFSSSATLAPIGAYTINFSSANGGQVFGGAPMADPTAQSILDGGSTDNCTVDGLVFTTDVDALTCAELGDTTITLTVTDAAGNATSCTSVVTVSDTLAPVILLTDAFVTLNLNGTGDIDIADIASATDNCTAVEDIIFTADRSLVFGCEDIGSQTVIVTATDESGNSSVDTLEFIVDFEQPNFACIARLNVTLNDDCQFFVEPSQVLRGNTACLDVFGFDIVVMDGDTSNGPIIDGCGTFDYMIRSIAPASTSTTGFVGDYAEQNWTVSSGANASVTFTDETIVLTSGGADDNASASYMFMESTEVTFSIDYSLEADIIPDVLVVDFNGDVVFESDDIDLGVGGTEVGSEDFILTVEPGNTLTIMIEGDGFATGGQISEVTVRDFVAGTSSLLGLDFETCWGTINAEDKTPVTLEETPDNILSGLLCADVDANNINTLGSSVSKCFLVDGDGTIIPGTIDAELLSILSPDAFDDVEPDTALIPTFVDGCASTIEVCVSDVVARPADGCGQTIITRTFRANEASGCAPLNPDEQGDDEEVVASYTISFDRPSLDNLNAENIQPVVEIEACGNATSPLEFLPTENDFPFLQFEGRTFSLASNEAACSMIATTFENSPNLIQTCPFTVKFQRTFTVVDWCNPTAVQTFTQFVKIGDTTGPTFSGPSGTIDGNGNLDPILTYRTNVGGECAAFVRLDGPGVGAIDECSGSNVITTVAIYPDGDLTEAPFGAYPVLTGNGAPEMSDALPIGDYAFVYTSRDECGNQTVSTVPFQVVDGSGPSAICENGLNVTLSRPAGLAVVTPDQIDKGSADDCSSTLTYQVGVSSSMTDIPTEFDDQITFTCDDLGTQFVTLEVTDEMENSNYCWATVLVELKDNDVPTCIAPSAVTLTCSQFTTALPGNLEEATDAELNAAFGVATGVGTCGTEITGTFILNNLNECGIGTAIREYSATDPQGGVSSNTCTQLITVVGVYDYQITLPGNASTSDCMDEFEAEELSITGGACDVPVVTTVTEEIFNTPGAECYQIRTTYTIINTCEFDPATGGTTVITRAGLDVANNDPIYLNVVSRSSNTEADDFAFVSGSANAQFTPNDDDDLELVGYAASSGRGSFTYVQNINVSDRTSPVVQVAAPAACLPGCTADLSLPFTAMDECLAPRITLELDPNFTGTFTPAVVDGVVITLDATDADNGNYVVNATGIPAGDHAIRITAIDGCGNATPRIVQLSVCGDVAPVPLCIQTLVATLQMNADSTMAMAEVWATDFLTNSPLQDCFGDDVTKYGIVRSGEGPATVDQIGAKVFCEDAGDFVSFEVYAFSDNVSDDVPAEFCNVLVQVDEGDGVECGTDGNLIAGTVMTSSSNLMSNIEVTLTGSNDMDEMQMTDENGAFSFANLPTGGDFTLTPTYQEPVNLQEVKISDVVMISSVILGTREFDSPYDYLAADVTQDLSLNVLDMVAIQRVILGLDNIYRSGESWGFVPANVDVSNPYAAAFPEVINANDITANILDADFVTFAYGNVTGEGRTAMTIETADAALAAGEMHTLTIDATDFAGFQGTIELAAGLELVSADYTGTGAMNLNYAAQGQIAVALRGGTVSLEVRATEAGNLSDLVSLTDAIAVREGVQANGTSGIVNLTFGASVAGEAVTSLGNATPNPVIESTLINYTLAADSDVTLSIQDVQGRTILVRSLRGTAGINGEVIDAADLKGATGVLTYTLVAGDFTATKKMVVVR